MTDQPPACIHPDGYDGECPCPPSCDCCKVAPAAEPLRARIAEAIEDAIYEHRERTCQWGETDGTTQEIARRATNAVMAVVDPSPPPLNLPRETVATLHDMLGRLLATNPATSSDTDDPLREQYAALLKGAALVSFIADDGYQAMREATGEELADAVLAVRDREMEQLRAKVAEIDRIINWHTTCASCARILDSSYAETMRAETAEATLTRLRTRVQAAADEARGSMRGWLVDALADLPDPRTPAHDGGPTVAEATADDEAHWTAKYDRP